MSTAFESLVRNLLAAGTAPFEDSHGVYLLREENGELLRTLWTETGAGEQRLITDSVRANTSAIYLNDPDCSPIVICLDTSSRLKASKYDEDEDEWADVELQGSASAEWTIHPNGTISGCYTPDGVAIVFQDTEGLIRVIDASDDLEKSVNLPDMPAHAVAGSPLHVVAGEEELHLFYLGQGNEIQHVSIGYATKQWNRQKLDNAKLSNPVTKFTALPIGDTGKFEIYAIAGDSLVKVADGSQDELGMVQNGHFVPKSKAEHTVIINGDSWGMISIGNTGGRRRQHRHRHRRTYR